MLDWMMGHRRAGFNAAVPRLRGRQPRALGMHGAGRGVSSNRSKSSIREAPQPQIDSVHGHPATFPKDIYYLVPGFGVETSLTRSPAGIVTATRLPFRSPIASVDFSSLNLLVCMARLPCKRSFVLPVVGDRLACRNVSTRARGLIPYGPRRTRLLDGPPRNRHRRGLRRSPHR